MIPGPNPSFRLGIAELLHGLLQDFHVIRSQSLQQGGIESRWIGGKNALQLLEPFHLLPAVGSPRLWQWQIPL